MATAGKHKSRYPESEEVKLSKLLSSILRHNFEKEGLKAQPGGYIYVEDLLALPKFKKYTFSKIEKVVTSNEKQRFSLMTETDSGRVLIRANQGHSIKGLDLDLVEVTSACNYPLVIHGTYRRCIDAILAQGLSKMGRNHIHFATGMPGDDDVISGMRASCQVVIRIDMAAAIAG
eukprot:TRINITY_DN1437_c1_g1_i1.p1 TRINITY_DN1437_c1_g1~~TRINITY_DN1437_c1_g1_i1.p1  ORF type:complete len:188 (+),score=40.65 TRINITY_DN1437_c1_g1_i1:41-565(+)